MILTNETQFKVRYIGEDILLEALKEYPLDIDFCCFPIKTQLIQPDKTLPVLKLVNYYNNLPVFMLLTTQPNISCMLRTDTLLTCLNIDLCITYDL